MVDINLMGEEERSEDRRREDDFAKTVNLDEPQTDADQTQDTSFTQDTFGGGFQTSQSGTGTFAKPSPSETYNDDGSTRNRNYLIFFAIILVALAALFYMIPSNDDQSDGNGKIANIDEEDPPTTESDPIDDPNMSDGSKVGGMDDPTVTPAPPDKVDPMAGRRNLSSLPPLERELLTSAKLSSYTVNAIARSLSNPNDFTLITYHGNHRFFVEFLSSSDDVTSEVTETIKTNTSPSELKKVSQSPYSVNGRTMNKVLLSGIMDEQSGELAFSGDINRMNSGQFSDWLKQISNENGLSIQNFLVGRKTNEGGQAKTPIQAHFSGSKANIASFLTEMSDQNPSVAVSKIIVSPSDRRTLNTNNLNLVMHLGFVEL